MCCYLQDMNFFSMHMSPVGRGGEGKPGRHKGLIKTVSYNSASCLYDSAASREYDFTDKTGVDASWLYNAAGNWMDRQEFWHSVLEKNSRANAVLAREIIFALPKELTRSQRLKLTEEFCRFIRTTYHVATDTSIHLPRTLTRREVSDWKIEHSLTGEQPPQDNGNHHCHILISACEVDENGAPLKRANSLDPIYCRKNGLVNPAEILRAKLAELINESMKETNCSDLVDHRSFERQGISHFEATKHIGLIGSEIKKSNRPCHIDIQNKIKKIGRLLRECKRISNQRKAIEMGIVVTAAKFLLHSMSLKSQLKRLEEKIEYRHRSKDLTPGLFRYPGQLGQSILTSSIITDNTIYAAKLEKSNNSGDATKSHNSAPTFQTSRTLLDGTQTQDTKDHMLILKPKASSFFIRRLPEFQEFEAWQFREKKPDNCKNSLSLIRLSQETAARDITDLNTGSTAITVLDDNRSCSSSLTHNPTTNIDDHNLAREQGKAPCTESNIHTTSILNVTNELNDTSHARRPSNAADSRTGDRAERDHSADTPPDAAYDNYDQPERFNY